MSAALTQWDYVIDGPSQRIRVNGILVYVKQTQFTLPTVPLKDNKITYGLHGSIVVFSRSAGAVLSPVLVRIFSPPLAD